MIEKEDLIGTWTLESWTIGYSDRDEFTYPYGEDPRGVLIYGADGWMSVCVARREREGLPQDVSFRKLPDSLKAAAFSWRPWHWYWYPRGPACCLHPLWR